MTSYTLRDRQLRTKNHQSEVVPIDCSTYVGNHDTRAYVSCNSRNVLAAMKRIREGPEVVGSGACGVVLQRERLINNCSAASDENLGRLCSVLAVNNPNYGNCFE